MIRGLNILKNNIIFIIVLAIVFICGCSYGQHINYPKVYSDGNIAGYSYGYADGLSDGKNYTIYSQELKRNWVDAEFFNYDTSYGDAFECYYKKGNKDLWVCVNITTNRPIPGYSWVGVDITKYLPGYNYPLTVDNSLPKNCYENETGQDNNDLVMHLSCTGDG